LDAEGAVWNPGDVVTAIAVGTWVGTLALNSEHIAFEDDIDLLGIHSGDLGNHFQGVFGFEDFQRRMPARTSVAITSCIRAQHGHQHGIELTLSPGGLAWADPTNNDHVELL